MTFLVVHASPTAGRGSRWIDALAGLAAIAAGWHSAAGTTCAQDVAVQIQAQVMDAAVAEEGVEPGLQAVVIDGETVVVGEAVAPVQGQEGAIGDAQPAEALSPEQQLQQAVEQQTAQFLPLFRSELNSQLDLIRTIQGDIPEAARLGIVRAGENAAKEAARRTSEVMHAPQRAQIRVIPNAGGIVAGVVRGFLGLNRPQPRPAPPPDEERFDGTHHLAAALADSLEEHVGDGAARAFEAEMVKRDERRRQAVVHKVVATLDDDLCLSSEQAEAIGEALLAEWDESLMAVTAFNFVTNGDRKAYPGLPRKVVVPHLTAAQRQRFGGTDENDNEQAYRQHWARMGPVNRLQRVNGIDRDPWWPNEP